MTLRPDVCVVGRGIAAGAAALCLLELGHGVVIAGKASHGPRFPRSVPRPCLSLFEHLGVAASCLARHLAAPEHSLSRWEDDQARPAPHPSFLLDTDSLARDLLSVAAQRGALVLEPSPVAAHPQGDGAFRVATAGEELQTSQLVLASSELFDDRVSCGQPTEALVATWLGRARATCSVQVDATPSGWFWVATLPDGTVHALVLEQATDHADPAKGLERARTETEHVVLPERSPDELGVVDATPRRSEQCVVPGLIRIGSAAFTHDPVAGQGVSYALTSARQAASAVHTLRELPDSSDAVDHFLSSRLGETVAAHARYAGAAYALGARRFGSEFWRSRQSELEPEPAAIAAPLPSRLVLSDLARIEATAVLDRDLIRFRPALVHPRLERPIAFIAGHPIARIVDQVTNETLAAEVARFLWSRGVLVASAAS